MKTTYIIILLVIFILVISVYNQYNSEREGFTPFLRKMYRPHLRNARLGVKHYYTKYTNQLYNMSRKFGIL